MCPAAPAEALTAAGVVNLVQTIQALKDRGFWIYGADTRGGRQPDQLVIEGDIALVMGSEGRGIRPLVRRQLDFSLSVPLAGRVDSLNVSVAAGIILHAIMRQRARQ